MKPRSLFILLLTLALSDAGQIMADTNLFQQGVTAYRAGEFAGAAECFQTVAAQTPASGALVNLGLAKWHQGRAGEAVLAWEQARWIDPYDHRAAANLAYARQLTGVAPPDFSWNERASVWLPVNAWAWIAGISLWGAIAVMVLPSVLRRRKTSWQQAIAALGLALFFVSLPAHYGVLTRTKLGVVLKKNLPLRLTPTADAEVMMKLAAGEVARELRTHGDYVLVRTSEGEGWIERRHFGRICP